VKVKEIHLKGKRTYQKAVYFIYFVTLVLLNSLAKLMSLVDF